MSPVEETADVAPIIEQLVSLLLHSGVFCE